MSSYGEVVSDMKYLGYLFAKVVQKLITHSSETISDYYRRCGVEVGKNTVICCYIPISEPALVSIGNDCVLSSEVALITHDHSINKVTEKGSNLFGKIVIGDNCFIGQRSIILYGVTLPDNTIVGSGSVVVKSFSENNTIIAGNPAKRIGNWEDFKEKYEEFAAFRNELEDIVQGKLNKIVEK